MGISSFYSSIHAVAANITDPPGDITVTAPGAVSFTCTASGVPRPNITWFSPSSETLMSGNNGVTIMEMEEGERDIVSTLSIAMTAPSVVGQYRCVADNGVTGVGDVNDVTAFLMVYGKPWTVGTQCSATCVSLSSVSDGNKCVP